ncbi:amino acid adenylation domain-containing protein [Streptomyces sp. NPDC127068]|uniref:non-ribosomal peptide synthetase n=1 Tax=Streptomyces sp. NPDC127068 TaxID=3347127 RepID=UPI0036654F9F
MNAASPNSHPYEASDAAPVAPTHGGLLARLVESGAAVDAPAGRLRVRLPRTATPDRSLLDAVRARRAAWSAELGDAVATPLSDVQRRLWFLQQLDDSGRGYAFAFVNRLSGRLDPAALSTAVDEVAAANPGLRATFEDVDGVPVQRIGPGPPVVTVLREARGMGDDAVGDLLRAELIAPFDLSKGPLLRSVLARTGDSSWLWGIAFHHLIGDGWTYALFNRAVAGAYLRLTTTPGVPAHTGPRADYVDQVLADRERRTTARRAEAMRFWVDRLKDRDEAEIPTDHVRPPVRTYRGSRTDVALPPFVVDGLNEVARKTGGTLFSALLAVHGVFLGQHTGSLRPTVGTPYANRAEQRFTEVMGCFVSTLPLSVDLAGDPSFEELAGRTARVCTEAWDHTDFSYAELSDVLAPRRDTSRNALFQSFLAFQDVPAPLALNGVETAPVIFDSGVCQFDVEFHLTPREDGSLRLAVLHNRDLFAPESARAFADRWALLARRAAADPTTAVPQLNCLSPADEDRLAPLEPDPEPPGPADLTVDDLFTDRVARDPARTAVVAGNTRLTYAELDTVVDGLAVALDTSAPGGGPVGVLLPRTAALPAVLLASVRAGRTFVPIALDAPTRQVDKMVRALGIQAAWVTEGTQGVLPSEVRRIIPVLDLARPAGRPYSGRLAQTPAYIMHTSGSTGEPKAVVVGHRALTNLITAMAEEPGISAEDTLLAITAPFFDIALLELIAPLTVGACLNVADDRQVHDPRALAGALVESGATLAQATPSTWRMLTDTGWNGDPRLTVWSGGEPLPRDLAERLLTRNRALWNLYGPTETTIWSTRHRVRSGHGPVPIGTPIARTGLHVLDRHRTPVPPGTVGELHISGDGLAQGYLGRPDLTDDRFAPVTTADGRHVRAYRTGDLVRLAADGTLICLGRTDDQIKLRGQRLEPGEIETALTEHPAVREAVVVTTRDAILVAHVRTDTAEAAPSAGELAAFLGERLRSALLPGRYVLHDSLPRTANGKIDRAVLRLRPLPAVGPMGNQPETPTERAVAASYGEVLTGVSPGRTDDFFDLGGHSLSAVRVLHRLHERTGVRVPLHVFLTDGRVGTVAALVDQARHDEGAAVGRSELERALELLDSLTDEQAARIAGAQPPDPSTP